MSYLLYLPGVKTGGDDAFARLGLYELIKDGGPHVMHGPGPDGSHGLFASWGTIETPPDLTWREGEQVWRSIEDGRYWLGKSATKKVDPLTIARTPQRIGGAVVLGDGQEWLIPVAKLLPHRWGMGGKRIPKDKFEAFCQCSAAIYGRLKTAPPDENVRIPFDEGWALACAGLAINYHVNEQVVDFLELVDDECFTPLASTIIQGEEIDEVEEQKKTEDAATPVG